MIIYVNNYNEVKIAKKTTKEEESEKKRKEKGRGRQNREREKPLK